MSALHRLAHPLIGYDSIQALAPKARRRRQESVERVSQRCNQSGCDMLLADCRNILQFEGMSSSGNSP